jgi:hypothetical protein
MCGDPKCETQQRGHGRLEERHSWTLLERSYNRLRAVLLWPDFQNTGLDRQLNE